jgi:hypothetical protein
MSDIDIAELTPRKNPHLERLTTPMTLSIPKYVIRFFEEMSAETGIPVETLINNRLKNYVEDQKALGESLDGQRKCESVG